MSQWKPNCDRRLAAAIAAITILGALSGCGGSGGSGTASGPPAVTQPPADTPHSSGTAIFHVDVATGDVTVSPITDTGESSHAVKPHVIFSGSAVAFHSSQLLNQPGNVGLKTLSVSITNNWGLPVGATPDGAATGLRVLFSPFTNVAAFSDVRSKTNVTTLAGSGTSGITDGSAASATFRAPSGIAVSGGAVYVTDYSGNTIRKIANGFVSTLAGSGVAGSTNGLGTAATFNSPFGIAVNPVDGALIVSDFTGNFIRRVTSSGRVTTVAGTGTLGGANGTGAVATFNGPAGIPVDAAGAIYVAEYNGEHIRKIVLMGADPTLPVNYMVTTFAGTGSAGSVDGIGTAASFLHPAGLALGPDGTLYTADQGNNKIRRISPAAEVLTIAGTGAVGTTDGPGNTATFNSPRGIAFLNGALIISDQNGNRIRQLSLRADGGGSSSSATGWQVASLAGSGAAGTADGTGDVATFNQPQFVAVDTIGNIYVPDIAGNKVRKVTPNGGFFPIGIPTGTIPVDQVQLSNPTGFIPNQAAGSNLPYVKYPEVLASGASSAAQNWNFLVPSGVTAFEFTVTVEAVAGTEAPPEANSGAGSANAIVRTLAGKAGAFGFVDGVGAAARFGSFVQGLCTDRFGDVFIADFHNNAIRRITPDGTVATIAGVLATGGGSAIDGAGNVARFNGPSAVACVPDGSVVYVGDANNNKIRRLSIAQGLDPTVAANWFVATIAGSGTQNTADGAGNVASLVLPEGVTLDPTGNIYVSEDAGNRIKRVTLNGTDPNVSANWQVRTVAGDTSTTFPATNWVDGPGNSARFADPVEIGCDGAGNVLIADSFNNRIRKMASDGTVTTIAGSTFGYVDANGASAQFSQPNGLAVDSAGFMYVADTSGERIRRVSPNGTVTTIAGTGVSGATDGPGNTATFTSPFGIAVDTAGNLYTGDTAGTIRIIQRRITSGN